MMDAIFLSMKRESMFMFRQKRVDLSVKLCLKDDCIFSQVISDCALGEGQPIIGHNKRRNRDLAQKAGPSGHCVHVENDER
jgi:hypothetical protein